MVEVESSTVDLDGAWQQAREVMHVSVRINKYMYVTYILNFHHENIKWVDLRKILLRRDRVYIEVQK